MSMPLVKYKDDPRDNSRSGRNTARASIRLGRFKAKVELDVTPAGLLAVGGLVSAILLSVVPIVAAATRRKSSRN